jgi:uncharacterized lipoprotein YajG
MIGRQRDGYGLALGDVQLKAGETVETRTRMLIREGLKRHGYKVAAESSNTINVSINQFWAWFTPGLVSSAFESQLSCEIDMVVNGRHEKFTVDGRGRNAGGIASDANWKISYRRAFADFLDNLDFALSSAKF